MTRCSDLNCSLCCHEREVILTHEDVDKLLTMGHYEQTFARKSRHGHNLKELIFIGGDCIFLKNGTCSVYNNRPTACRIFPYSMEEGRECFDEGCPHRSEFRGDPVFLEDARSGFNRIIEDVRTTMSRYEERKRQEAI